MTESWRPVVGFEDRYEVSELGRVRSLLRGRLRSLSTNSRGYVVVSLWRDNQPTTKRVNRMVLEAFVGRCPPGMEGCHGNGNRTDNRLGNLRWGTHLENMRDQLRHGTQANTQKTECPKGHPDDAENTYRRPGSGGRGCLVCRREAVRAHRLRQREATS